MNGKKIVFTVGEVVFVVLIPAILVIMNYTSWGSGTLGFKISLSGIVLLLVVYVFLRKVILKKRFDRLRDSLTQHMADLKVETDEEKKKALKDRIKFERTIECVLNFITPALLLGALFVLCQALETAAVKMSGTVGFIAASEIVGFVFSILEAREV